MVETRIYVLAITIKRKLQDISHQLLTKPFQLRVVVFQLVKHKEYCPRLRVPSLRELIKLLPQVPTKMGICDNLGWLT
jgi:hypothetical protein